MLQNWLDGKKKYSAFIITIAAAILESLNLSPELQAEITAYIPMLATIASGIAYIIIQGRIDNSKTVANSTNGSATAAAVATVIPTTQTSAPSAVAAASTTVAQPAAAAAVPFNAEEFDKLVEEKAKTDYLEANDITRYFAAQDLGNTSKWAGLYHQLAYQDYMVAKAMKAFEGKFGFPYAEADKHLADDKKCPYYSVDNMARQKGIDFWYMLRMVRQTLARANELSNSS